MHDSYHTKTVFARFLQKNKLDVILDAFKRFLHNNFSAPAYIILEMTKNNIAHRNAKITNKNMRLQFGVAHKM